MPFPIEAERLAAREDALGARRMLTSEQSVEAGTATAAAESIAVADPERADVHWLQRYARSLVVVDGAILLVSSWAAVTFRFGGTSEIYGRISYYVVAALLVLVWWTALGFSRCYETRFVGSGTEEY